MWAIDTEDTGLDFFHGSVPFFVTACDGDNEPVYWSWSVDPLTRKTLYDPSDLKEIQQLLDGADRLVGQNFKFDIRALVTAGLRWDHWDKVEDTQLAAHLLESCEETNLTALALRWLGIDIYPLEKALNDAVKQARSIARRDYPEWRIAKPKEMPDGPSVRDSKGAVASDKWLPRALALELGYPDDHEWLRVLPEYANADSAVTAALWKVFLAEMERKQLLPLYECRKKLIRVVYEMEARGVTYSQERMDELREEYREESARLERLCVKIAASYPGEDGGPYQLTLPKSGVNKSLRHFIFGPLGIRDALDEQMEKDVGRVIDLEQIGYDRGSGASRSVLLPRSKKTGAPSLNKAVLEHLAETAPESSKERVFFNALRDKRKRDTALAYMDGYERAAIPLGNGLWLVLHPSLHMTGTWTLRFSSSNPNEQNISKQKGFNLRYLFGPAPGREWWSLDYQNIELRIPAYEAEETEMIALFERPDDPPYYGSNHLLAAHTLWPEEFEACLATGESFKDKYKSTLYQWTKNGNFAVQYGAMNESGTADRAYHQVGGQRKIEERFTNIKRLNQRMIKEAERTGYVRTMADKEIGCGYPLKMPLSEWGKVKPTIPLNYHVQGTAMWCMCKAMIRVSEYLRTLKDFYIVMQVHDELNLDFPAGTGPKPWLTNLPKIRRIKRLMEKSGEDIGVPLTVSVTYHADNWSEGLDLAL